MQFVQLASPHTLKVKVGAVLAVGWRRGSGSPHSAMPHWPNCGSQRQRGDAKRGIEKFTREALVVVVRSKFSQAELASVLSTELSWSGKMTAVPQYWFFLRGTYV
jgi:hypothetical protein